MNASFPVSPRTHVTDTEAKLLADCYGLLLADIRRNRARRLAQQGKALMPADGGQVSQAVDGLSDDGRG